MKRYGDDEVREIFSLATTGDTHDPQLPAESGGLTLDEITQIGVEAGIEPARVASAAASVATRSQPVSIRRAFGMPIGVSRQFDLPRAPTDREWEQLIAQCRSTFGVQGVATSSGGLRDWSEGNLHIAVEPTERGEQLRLSTLNDAAVALNGAGIGMGVMSIIMAAVVTAGGKPDKAVVVAGMFGGLAIAAFGANLLRVPGWARDREHQINAIAEHALKLLSSPEPPSPEW